MRIKRKKLPESLHAASMRKSFHITMSAVLKLGLSANEWTVKRGRAVGFYCIEMFQQSNLLDVVSRERINERSINSLGRNCAS